MKPMLAGSIETEQLSQLRLPVYVQVKLDGIRALLLQDSRVVSRSFKDIPNRFIRETLGQLNDPRFAVDGELMLRNPNASFQEIVSTVMTESGEPDFVFHVFDVIKPNTQFSERLTILQDFVQKHENTGRVVSVPVTLANSTDEILQINSDVTSAGGEGIMFRSPSGLYKFGRSTMREQYLLKYKGFADSEAVVENYEQRLHNANALEEDELGYAKRSTHKENMVPVDELGALVVKDLVTNVCFSIGTGFTQEQRKQLWTEKDRLIGKIVKYKYFQIGIKEETGVPRFPVFLGFRHADDM